MAPWLTKPCGSKGGTSPESPESATAAADHKTTAKSSTTCGAARVSFHEPSGTGSPETQLTDKGGGRRRSTVGTPYRCTQNAAPSTSGGPRPRSGVNGA